MSVYGNIYVLNYYYYFFVCVCACVCHHNMSITHTKKQRTQLTTQYVRMCVLSFIMENVSEKNRYFFFENYETSKDGHKTMYDDVDAHDHLM